MGGNFGFQVLSGDRTVWFKFHAHRVPNTDSHDVYISGEGLPEVRVGSLEPIYSYSVAHRSILHMQPLDLSVVLNHNGYDSETLQPYVALLLMTYAAENLR